MRAGFAQTDITPPPDVDLFGYDFRQERLAPGNDGIHDPIFARALAIAGDQTADGNAAGGGVILLSLDLLLISVPFARRLRAEIARRLGIVSERVIVACTHTHSGPNLDEPELVADLSLALPYTARRITAAGKDGTGQRHAAIVIAQAIEAAERAWGSLAPVTAAAASAAVGLAYDRRVVSADGVRYCWNPHETPELAPLPAADPALTVLCLRRAHGGAPIVVLNHGAHPVVLGKTSRVVSADWPGAALRHLDTHLGGAQGMFVLGACGDTHPWIATQADPAGIEPVGAAAGSLAACLAHAARPGQAQALNAVGRTIHLSGIELDVAAWRIGPAVLVAAPIELFSALGADLRRRCRRPLLLATNANGWTGYWPTRQSFAEGIYEIDFAKAIGRKPGESEALVDALAALIAEIDG